jgi:hypothetical protein
MMCAPEKEDGGRRKKEEGRRRCEYQYNVRKTEK